MIRLLLIVLALPIAACTQSPPQERPKLQDLVPLANERGNRLYRYEDSELTCVVLDGARYGGLQCFQKKETAK